MKNLFKKVLFIAITITSIFSLASCSKDDQIDDLSLFSVEIYEDKTHDDYLKGRGAIIININEKQEQGGDDYRFKIEYISSENFNQDDLDALNKGGEMFSENYSGTNTRFNSDGEWRGYYSWYDYNHIDSNSFRKDIGFTETQDASQHSSWSITVRVTVENDSGESYSKILTLRKQL